MDALNSKLKWVDVTGFADMGAGDLLIAELWDITHGHRVAVIIKRLATKSYSLLVFDPHQPQYVKHHSKSTDLQALKDIAVAIVRITD